MPIQDGLPTDFYEYFDAMMRLEPRSRSEDFSAGVAAPIADPLWLLARQWQMGEFKADNAGSPLKVEMSYQTQPVESLKRSENAALEKLDNMPVEVLVEREAFPMTWRARVRIGQEFERRARTILGGQAQALIDLYRNNYGLQRPPDGQWIETDRNTRRFIQLMSGKVIDGKFLLRAFEENDLPTPPAGIATEDVDKIFDHLSRWRKELYCEPESDISVNSWVPDDLNYSFDLYPPSANPSRTHLVADNYRSGDFDWHSVKGGRSLQGEWSDSSNIKSFATRISVGGASPRWWAFEDAKTDFGDLDVATPDLAKLLMMEFVLAHGDDWFSVPLSIETGNLVGIKELQISNVFGEKQIDIPSALKTEGDPLQCWEVFTIAGVREFEDPDISSCLYVPRVAAYRDESPPIEEVRFLRDEGANMVWGVEHILPDGLGKPVHGFEAQLERYDRIREAELKKLEEKIKILEEELRTGDISEAKRIEKEAEIKTLQEQLANLTQTSQSRAQQTSLQYRLATSVPDNWIPFVPAKIQLEGQASRVRLNRAQMLKNTEDEEPTPIPALSRLLDNWDDPLLWLEEYAVTRAGVRVLLTKQRVRDAQGRTFVWLGKKVLTGRGEGSSGLRFDTIKE